MNINNNLDNKHVIQARNSLIELVNSKGGSLLTEYMGYNKPITLKCKDNHIWTTKPKHLKSGKWCRQCAGLKVYDIDYFKKLAKTMGGRCLSTDYRNLKSHLKFECKKCDYIWEIGGHSLISGHFCPRCAGNQRHDIETMQKWAAKRGGRCLSKVYVNNVTKLEWLCEHGHSWHGKPTTIQQGRWCPVCSSTSTKRS